MAVRFDSFEELKIFVMHKEKTDFIQLYVENSRTIEAAKRKLKRELNENLKYYEIKYRCIHSGTWKSQSTGKRPGRSTFKQNCPFLFRLRASADGKSLEVQEFVDEHNHIHTEEMYAYLPRQRQLDEPSKALVRQMLEFGASKKLLQVELLKGKKVILKDLNNLHARSAAEDPLEETLKYLAKKQSDIEIIRNENNVFLGIFYQSQEMKIIFNRFPEVLFVDVIHKVSNRQMILYIFAIEDANGEAQIVAFFLAGLEDAATVLKMVQLFKKHNAAWKQTQTIMTDKDFQVRYAFRKEFSHSNMLIGLYHTLQIFKREITTEKLGIYIGERCKCQEIAQKLVYSKNEKEYNSILKEIKSMKIKSFIDYILKNWHPIRHEWVISLQKAVTFNNRTSSRIRSLILKIIKVVESNSELPDLFKNLDILICSLRTEREVKAMRKHLKKSLMKMQHEDQEQYFKVLTPYAYGLVADKFKKINDVKVLQKTEDEGSSNPQGSFKVQSSAGVLHVTTKSCSCAFFPNMGLPCHHILRIRQILQMNLFEADLVLPRWTRNYSVNNTLSCNTVNEITPTCVTAVPTKKMLSQHDKFRLVCQKIQRLSFLASDAPSELFPQRIDVIDKIISLWEKNLEIGGICLEDGSSVEIEKIFSQPDEVSHHMNCLVKDVNSAPVQEFPLHQDEISHQITTEPSVQEHTSLQDEVSHQISCHEKNSSSVPVQEFAYHQEEISHQMNTLEDGSSFQILELTSQQDEVSHQTCCLEKESTSVPVQEFASQQDEIACEVTVLQDGSLIPIEDGSSKAKQVWCVSQHLSVPPAKTKKRGRPKSNNKTVVKKQKREK